MGSVISLKSFSAVTNQGPYLQANEDAIEVDLANSLYILVDGIGGSLIGDRAANLVKETIKKTYTTISGDPDSTLPFFYRQKYLIEGNALANAMHRAHAVITEENKGKNINEMSAASCVAVCQAENILTLVGTGNCVAYLFRRGVLKELIVPDCLEDLSFDNYQRHFSTTPMSGVGLFEDVNLTIREHRVLEGDLLLLMSDGAYGRIQQREIQSLMGDGGKNSDEKIDKIFQLSNSRGNLDNQSCIILNY